MKHWLTKPADVPSKRWQSSRQKTDMESTRNMCTVAYLGSQLRPRCMPRSPVAGSGAPQHLCTPTIGQIQISASLSALQGYLFEGVKIKC